jgi:hypothetical protein
MTTITAESASPEKRSFSGAILFALMVVGNIVLLPLLVWKSGIIDPVVSYIEDNATRLVVDVVLIVLFARLLSRPRTKKRRYYVPLRVVSHNDDPEPPRAA